MDDNPVIEGEKKGTQTSADILDPLYVGGAPGRTGDNNKNIMLA